MVFAISILLMIMLCKQLLIFGFLFRSKKRSLHAYLLKKRCLFNFLCIELINIFNQYKYKKSLKIKKSLIGELNASNEMSQAS